MSNQINVLIVDDDKMNCKVFERYLRGSACINVVSCHSGDMALAIIDDAANNINLIVSDQRMPGMKGFELLERIKQRYPNITRILTSASNEEIDLILLKDKRSGIVEYFLEKPWDFQAFESFLISSSKNLG